MKFALAGKRSGGSDEGKRDEELPEEDDDSQRRRKRSKKSHDKEVLDGENLYQSHPLAVIVQVNDEKQKGSKLLTLRIEFLIKLNVLCVGEEGTLPGGVSPALSLANLFPDDNGLELPNQVNQLTLFVKTFVVLFSDITKRMHSVVSNVYRVSLKVSLVYPIFADN